MTGLFQTVAVYRLFGPVVTSSLSGSIPYINGLTRLPYTSTPVIEMDSNYFASSGGFGQALNTTNMYSNPSNNTFTYSNSDTVNNVFGSSYGAGYTISCFYFNIFASSTVQWSNPPANTATTCTIFGYVYNELVGAGNAFKNGQWMYVTFCPIDSSFSINSPDANINFLNPQYPLVFTNNFLLRSVLTIAFSDQYGYIRAYRHETNGISSLLRSCTTSKLQTYNPTSAGKQRSTFTLALPAIPMSATGYSGYSSFRVYFTIPSTTANGVLSMLGNCDTSNTLLTCQVISASSSTFIAQFNYASTGTATITYL